MKTENVLYTDGRDVTVTDSVLHVKSKDYELDKIKKHDFSILEPVRFPGITVFVIGLVLILAGGIDMIHIGLTTILGVPVDGSLMALAAGFFLVALSAILMWSMRQRYAVRITTAEGEKDVVVSSRKAYITQIIRALNEAFFARSDPGSSKMRKQQYRVSGR
jgi:hypothetical protein